MAVELLNGHLIIEMDVIRTIIVYDSAKKGNWRTKKII